MIFNGAPDYRRAIYLTLDREYDCDWYFIGIETDTKAAKEMDVSLLRHVGYLKPHTFIKSPISYTKGLYKLIIDKRYDTYLMAGDLWNVSVWIFCIMKNIFFRKKRIFFWTHGILRVRKWPINLLSKWFFKMPDLVFTYGDRAKQVMISEGLDGSKIWPIHNSLDYDEQIKLRGNITALYKEHFKNNNPTLVFIGRLTKVKKLDMLVKAVEILHRQRIEVNLTLVGDGTERASLESQVKQLGLSERVWFYGKCYEEIEKSELIANAVLCVAPGNIGLTAMDSLVYGTPCLTMDNFDLQMPEHEAIKEGITGSFFKENDVNDLAEKITDWLQNNQKRDLVRQDCYQEIDTRWNPNYQLKIIKEHLF